MLPASKESDVVKATRNAIARRIARGHPHIQEVAASCRMTTRPLQRHLAEAGITYSRIIDEVRFEAACRLLEDPGMTLAEIASALGYSDPGNFTRAFTRWTGMTPRAYRQRCRQKP
jgi:AraC-like DNA-binding protein